MSSNLKVFIDSNIPMYSIGGDHPYKNRAIEILRDIEGGKIFAVTSCEVFQEILHRYKYIGKIQVGFDLFDNFYEIVDDVLPLNSEIVKSAKLILEKNHNKGISLRDCIHLSTMYYYGINYLASFDMHFKQFKGINYYK